MSITEMHQNPDLYFMKEAYRQALRAFDEDEIPVGAVIVWNQRVISKAFNYTEKLTDVTAHAEMQAITAATHALGGKYLNDCTLYVTLEPCVMCAGALFWSQIGRVVYGASDPKRGYSKIPVPLLHPKTKVTSGILEEECSELLRRFFSGKRR